MQPSENQPAVTASELLDLLIRLALIITLAVICYKIFSPFVTLIVWAAILAIAIYPLHQRLAGYFNNRQGLSSTAIVLAVVLLAGVPTTMLGVSVAEQFTDWRNAIENNTFSVPEPKPGIEKLPVVGKKIYAAWVEAAEDFPAFRDEHGAQLQSVTRKFLSMSGTAVVDVFGFIGSMIIAGIMMAYGNSGTAATHKIFSHIVGADRGPALQTLCVATVRSVAVGVIGIAFIQALLLGVGFIGAGVPFAGILAVLVLLVGIVQVPAVIITIPVMVFIWSSGNDASTTMKAIWTVYLIVAGLSDGVLKPIFLGRGVEAPMPVILLGALGGMAANGMIGLFVGAVVLALGYNLFMSWVDNASADKSTLQSDSTD
jgi:predicted PurR-regulated permease PerM